MKIARFEADNGQVGYGIVDGDTPQAAELIEGDVFGTFRRTGRPATIKKLLAPVQPPNVIAIGLNYRDHAAESGMEIPKLPLVFLKGTTSVIGPDEPIVLPKDAPNEVDYEAELTVIIGKRGKDIPSDRVNEHILGYTCGNDVSARDCQLKIDSQWARGKSFDTFCPLGPWIVTADALDPSNVAIGTTVSGDVLQSSRTSQLVFSVTDLVVFLSRQFTLLPGTVIMTGTPPGVGFARKPPRFLRSGDEVIIEIEGIGRLRNPVA